MANVYQSDLDAFTIYHRTQQASSSTSSSEPILPALGHALAGSTGTAIANLAIYPLDLIITRLQIQRTLRKSSAAPNDDEYKGVLDAFVQIYNKEGGLKAFYVGVVESTTKSIADAFLFFLFYNFLRERRLQRHGSKATTLPVFDELAVGMVAGACSKAFTTPISNIVTRKQTASMGATRMSSSSAAKSPSVREIADQIRKEKGIQGFWSGYSASLVLTLNPSITFFLYETFKRVLLPRAQRDDPGARVTFLMAAISKSIASTITYPFSLAKARAQTSSRAPIDEQTKTDVQKLTESFEHVDDEEEVKKEAKLLGRDLKKLAKRSTVFNTVLSIYRAEGVEGLYEGIWGEILKGFFSHGGTMLVKEAVHKVIIQAYFMILKALDKFPSPGELANQAKTAVQDAGERAGEAVHGAVESGREAIGAGAESVGVMGGNATETVKNAGEYVAGSVSASVPGKRKAGGFVEGAREKVGEALEDAGKGIKPVGEGN